jgi:hypothetical protein
MDSRLCRNDIWSNEITTLSLKAHNDRGIKTNNIYLQMGEIGEKKNVIRL